MVGCTNNKAKNPDFKFCVLPCKKEEKKMRRNRWLQAIRHEGKARTSILVLRGKPENS